MRDKILEATAALLVAHGTQASMAAIAKRAGVATGSLYNHFENKDVLIRAVYDDLAAVMDDALVAGDDPSRPGPERLARYIDNHINFIWQNPERAVLFDYLSNVPLLPGDEALGSFKRTTDFIHNLLAELQRDGWAADGDVGVTAGLIGGAIRNMLKWKRALGETLEPETHAQIREMCLRAVRREPV